MLLVSGRFLGGSELGVWVLSGRFYEVICFALCAWLALAFTPRTLEGIFGG
jgi:hypothetical protein